MYSIAWNRSWPVGRVLRRRSAASLRSFPWRWARARPYAAVAPIAGAPRTAMSSIAWATSSRSRASRIRISNGRRLWSISFTAPSSSQTVRSSRGSPSTTTRTRPLLGSPEGGQEARQPRGAHRPLHVPGEGVVVCGLLVDLLELLLEAAALLLDLFQRLDEALLPRPPSDELPLGGLRRVVHRLPHVDVGARGGLRRQEGLLEPHHDPRVLGDLLLGMLELPEEDLRVRGDRDGAQGVPL